MNKKTRCILCLLGILFFFASCTEQSGASYEITIYGNVIDKTTGHPLYNVLMQPNLD